MGEKFREFKKWEDNSGKRKEEKPGKRGTGK